MIAILVIIILFVALFIWDLSLQSQVHKLYGECSRLLEDIKKLDMRSYEEIQKLYGKEFDMIGHRTPADFPVSLYYNLKDISNLGFLRDRLIQVQRSGFSDTL